MAWSNFAPLKTLSNNKSLFFSMSNFYHYCFHVLLLFLWLGHMWWNAQIPENILIFDTLHFCISIRKLNHRRLYLLNLFTIYYIEYGYIHFIYILLRLNIYHRYMHTHYTIISNIHIHRHYGTLLYIHFFNDQSIPYNAKTTCNNNLIWTHNILCNLIFNLIQFNNVNDGQ